jgi:hypothetical protein
MENHNIGIHPVNECARERFRRCRVGLETPGFIHARVIEAHPRRGRQAKDSTDIRMRARGPQSDLRCKNQQEDVRIGGQVHGRDGLFEKPRLRCLTVRLEPVDKEPVDVRSIQGALLEVPYRAFAANFASRPDASDLILHRNP